MLMAFSLNRGVLDYLFVTNADLDHISDLNNLWREGIAVSTFIRNRSVSPEIMAIIKEVSGELTDDIQRYLDLHASYVHPVGTPFDQNMGPGGHPNSPTRGQVKLLHLTGL